jgi:ketosteroid isomerase-like protein
MNTMEISNKLVAFCREGKNHEALETLFADDMVSALSSDSSTTSPTSPRGKRMKLDEVALYTISNGKIVREDFFYDAGCSWQFSLESCAISGKTQAAGSGSDAQELILMR